MLAMFAQRTASRSPVRSGLRARFQPRLDRLEDRTLLSVCLVDRPTDLGEGKELTGDLRYSLTQAQDKDSIQFAVQGTINLSRALPDLTRSVSIEGPGADLLTVRRDTGGFYRIFTVSSSATVSLSGLTISNGVGGGAGGGISNSGRLTISNSTLSGNSANKGGGGLNNTERRNHQKRTIRRSAPPRAQGGVRY